jgi:tetratricopeptide (TPR) repeat protein
LRYQTAISLQPDDARNYKQLALAYYRSRQLEEAVESLRIAVYLQPDSEQARFDLESVLEQKEKSLNAVLEPYLEKARTQPENPEVHYTLGVVYLSRGEPLQATKHFRAALESAPTSAVLWLKLGEALQRSKQLEEARTAYQQALRFQPDLPAARQQLGILEKERDNLDVAIEYLERTASAEKSAVISATARVASAETHYHLGDAYHRKRQLKAAMTAYHTAIRLKPDTALAYLRLAEIYEEMGNRGAAHTFYRRFIALAKPRPELHPQMREAEKRVEIAIE